MQLKTEAKKASSINFFVCSSGDSRGGAGLQSGLGAGGGAAREAGRGGARRGRAGDPLEGHRDGAALGPATSRHAQPSKRAAAGE